MTGASRPVSVTGRGLVNTYYSVDVQRLALVDLVEPLGAYGVDAELRQNDPGLTPWLHIRYGTVTTHGFVCDGWYRAFLGMPIAEITEPDAAARRIAHLSGVPGVGATGAAR